MLCCRKVLNSAVKIFQKSDQNLLNIVSQIEVMAGLGLVAEYSSSEDSDAADVNTTEASTVEQGVNFFLADSLPDDAEDDNEDVIKRESKSKMPLTKPKLANPLSEIEKRNTKCSNKLPTSFRTNDSMSVFYNPFRKEQEAKKQMLEKHVKLSENPKNITEIDGKKVCPEFRKGRCRFGRHCKFAHDSDVSVASGPVYSGSSKSSMDSYNASAPLVPVEDPDTSSKKRKPGLSEGLIPNKKSRKNFKMQQEKESPWLIKR